MEFRFRWSLKIGYTILYIASVRATMLLLTKGFENAQLDAVRLRPLHYDIDNLLPVDVND